MRTNLAIGLVAGVVKQHALPGLHSIDLHLH